MKKDATSGTQIKPVDILITKRNTQIMNQKSDWLTFLN